MKLTPEQIEEQQVLFESEFSEIPRLKFTHSFKLDKEGIFLNSEIKFLFHIWLKAIESQPKREIRLPPRKVHGNKDEPFQTNMISGFNLCLDEVKFYAEDQGFTVYEH